MDRTSSLKKEYFWSPGPKNFLSWLEDPSISPVFNNMMQCEEGLLVLCEKNSGAEVAALKQRRAHGPISLWATLKWSLMVLVLFPYLASAQSAQTIDSEVQLASLLCRNPTGEATDELLSDKNARFVTVTLWKALLECASSAQPQRSATKSIEMYRLTLRIADRLKKPELVATTYYYLGRTYARANDFANSIQAYETSRNLFEQAGVGSNLISVFGDLSVLYLTAEDYDNAKSYAQQSLAIADRVKSFPSKASLGPIEYGRARSLHTLGAIDLSRGNHADAIQKLGEALGLYERMDRTGFSCNIPMAEVLIPLARVYSEMGEYGQAFSFLNKAHQVSKSSGDQSTRADIMSSDAALFLEQEDYAAAEKYFNASLTIYSSLGNSRKEAHVLLNLAMIEEERGAYDDALQLLRRSMEVAKASQLVEVQIAAGECIADVLTAKHDFPKALETINQNLEIARRVNAKTHEAELLWRAAQTYNAMQNYRASAARAEQALSLARTLQLRKLTYYATASLGEAYAADGKVELAIRTLKEAINQVEEMRDQLAGRPEGRQVFFEKKVQPYHTLVKLLTEQGKDFEALRYAERAKGRVLLEAVRKNASDLQNIYTESEKAEAESLIDQLHTVNERIQSQPDGKATNDLQNQLDAVRGELVLFQERLATAHPELRLRAGPAKPLTRASLDDLIPANDFAYLEYVVTGESVGVFLLKRNSVTTEHDLKYLSLPVKTDELRRKVDEFHSALAERQPGYDSLGRELYKSLIEPITNELQNIKTIRIIPDGFLWTVPFQALTTTSGNYLIQQYSLYYAPSLTVLNEMALRRRQHSSKESLIAFGNPVIERNENLKGALHPLPETETEVTAVGATVRTRMKKVLVGPLADEKSFKALAPQYATIHLATHGVLDNRDPLHSYLLLTKTNDDRENDGRLQAREIIDMQLNADLVVLSACETGNGRISPGEGVIGMSWAFLFAGARSVVVSQWRVNSASTSRLMKNFYQALARQSDATSGDKSAALRDASLQMIKDRRYRHPFYWAGFVLVSSK